MSQPTPYGPFTHTQIIPPSESIEEAQSGYSWSGSYELGGPVYIYDCLFCGSQFMEGPGTGPHTGAGVMGLSYGLNVVCPRCGATNVTGPRLAEYGEVVIAPDRGDSLVVPGLSLFTGDQMYLVRIGY